jgi:hypothetical protein
MKKTIVPALLLLTAMCFGQSAKDGRANKTEIVSCDASNLAEPKANQKLREQIAKENGCALEQVKFLRFSQTKNVGLYTVCVAGKELRYRQTGKRYTKID